MEEPVAAASLPQQPESSRQLQEARASRGSSRARAGHQRSAQWAQERATALSQPHTECDGDRERD